MPYPYILYEVADGHARAFAPELRDERGSLIEPEK